MLNGSTSCSLFDCTSGCQCIVHLPEAQKKFVFMVPFGKFELKKVPFGLELAHTHFQ